MLNTNITASQVDRRSFLAVSASAAAAATTTFATPAKAATTPHIQTLIQKHRDAEANYMASLDAREALEPKRYERTEIFVRLSIGGARSTSLDDWPERAVETLRRDISAEYERAIGSVGKSLGHLDNELVAQATSRLRKARAADLRAMRRLVAKEAAKVEASAYGVARRANDEALDAERQAMGAVLSHRCKSLDELAEKAEYLATYFANTLMDDDHQSMLLASMQPEPAA